LDSSFGLNGLVIDDTRLIEPRALVIDQQQRLVVGGHGYPTAVSPFYHFAVRRFLQNGAGDDSFVPPSGSITPLPFLSLYDGIRGLAIQPDGKIVAAGVTDDGLDVVYALARYEP
jgi:hypothetical protein